MNKACIDHVENEALSKRTIGLFASRDTKREVWKLCPGKENGSASGFSSAILANDVEGMKFIISKIKLECKHYRHPPLDDIQVDLVVSHALNGALGFRYGWGPQAPLLIAALHGNCDAAAWLLEQKANVCAHDTLGNNALHQAVKGRKPSRRMIQLLLDGEAKACDGHPHEGLLQQRNAMGRTPIEEAQWRKDDFDRRQAFAETSLEPTVDLPRDGDIEASPRSHCLKEAIECLDRSLTSPSAITSLTRQTDATANSRMTAVYGSSGTPSTPFITEYSGGGGSGGP